MPSAGMSGLSWNGRHVISVAIAGRCASAASSRRLPIKHHGQMTSATISMRMAHYSTPRAPARLALALMDVVGARESLAQILDAETRRFAGVEDHLFALGEQVGGFGNLAGDVQRDDHRTVPVGMDQIVLRYHHAGDAHGFAEFDDVDIGVRRHDRSGEDKKVLRPDVDVAHRAVGDDADAAERLVDVRLDLAPERAEADIGTVDVLHDAQGRMRRGAEAFVISEADGPGAGFVARAWFARADHDRARIANHRLRLWQGRQ